MSEFRKTGLVQTDHIGEYRVEPDGSIWQQVFYHNNPTANKFSSSDNFASGQVYKSTDMWFDFTNCKTNTSYEFLYIQKNTASSSEVKYRWIQSVTPFGTSYDAVSPSAVTRITTSGYTDGGYGGLYVLGGNTYMVIPDGSPGDWWGATGCWTEFSGGIPGYPSNVCTSGSIKIYVRLTDSALRIIKNNNIQCSDIIEN